MVVSTDCAMFHTPGNEVNTFITIHLNIFGKSFVYKRNFTVAGEPGFQL